MGTTEGLGTTRECERTCANRDNEQTVTAQTVTAQAGVHVGTMYGQTCAHGNSVRADVACMETMYRQMMYTGRKCTARRCTYGDNEWADDVHVETT